MRLVVFAAAALTWGSGFALAAEIPPFVDEAALVAAAGSRTESYAASNAGAAFDPTPEAREPTAPGHHHRLYGHGTLATSADFTGMIDAERPQRVSLDGIENPHSRFEDADLAALRVYARQIGTEPAELESIGEIKNPHPQFEDADLAALRDYAQQIEGLPPGPAHGKEVNSANPHFGDADLAALRDYARQIGLDRPDAAATPRLRMAEADNALDALREYLRQGTPPDPPPAATPEPSPRTAPRNSTPRVTPIQPRPAASRPIEPVIDAQRLGTTTCLICHTSQADSFGKTMMGRIGKTQPGKFDCENCHGPASVHVKAGGCAACHGETASSKPGIPTLAGQDPKYLVPAMRAYISGGRRHELMRTILTGDGEADFNAIALYYSRQIPVRAQTPPLGDPAAGKAASALCAQCHGERGTSVYPAWPNLAGQDAQYLASAIREYKDGSRSKAVACAGCHGEGGVSKRPGIPSLAGQTPQMLLRAMKAYVSGARKHDLMKTMLSGLSEAELGKIALHYARQTPARSQTPLVGDPAAGKTASEDCAGCHGDLGISDNPKFPNLAGQDVQYLVSAIKAYKAKTRDFAAMQSATEELDERAIHNLASFFASLAPEKPTLTDEENKAPATPDPVVVKNALVASLDERTISNIASYFASLRPAGARSGPALPQPLLVGQAPHPGGRSLGSIISFRKNDPGRRVEDNNAICLGCHERGGRNYWSGSTHETRGVACTECHTVMQAVSRKANLKTESELDTCFQCHKDRRAQLFRSSHMPLREGKMVCSNCHNPHGSATDALLIESSINNTCYKCHAEKRGPFLFEHTPVRENCVNCHDPHGSVNEALLKLSRPRLCGECHTVDHGTAIAGGPKVVQAFGRACQNCHTKVHGTNSPSGALLQR